ncbi:MAG TPA: hypothetical protein VKV24_18200 [Casimicrobiaceae bacterium]|nr:hypothetical protein [Casimicrobiaceae bacterium]
MPEAVAAQAIPFDQRDLRAALCAAFGNTETASAATDDGKIEVGLHEGLDRGGRQTVPDVAGSTASMILLLAAHGTHAVKRARSRLDRDDLSVLHDIIGVPHMRAVLRARAAARRRARPTARENSLSGFPVTFVVMGRYRRVVG